MNPMPWSTRCILGALSASVGLGMFECSAPAQTVPASGASDTLVRLIKDHDSQRAVIERPLLATYAQRLAGLRDTLEKRRDPAAAAVAAELATVQARLSRLDTGLTEPPAAPVREAPLAGPLELLASQARTSGDVTPATDENGSVHFHEKGAAAEWTLPTLRPGRFRLLWRISCNVGAGASVRLLIDGQPPRTLEVVPTSAAGEPLVANLGEFSASTAPTSLRVEVTRAIGQPRQVAPGFSLGRIILIPPGVTMPGL